jgi:hypothetical protein
MTKPKSDHARRLEKVEQKLIAQAEAQKAKEAAEAAMVAETKQWLELAIAAGIEERKKVIGGRRPPTPERLKAMAMRFHMATASQDEYERMYIELLLQLINRLDDESRETFNQYLADKWKAKYE